MAKKTKKEQWPTGTLPKGTKVTFTVAGLGASELDELYAVVPETYGPGDVGIVAFPHVNQKMCKDWVLVEVDSKQGEPRKLYVGVNPYMLCPADPGASTLAMMVDPDGAPRAWGRAATPGDAVEEAERQLEAYKQSKAAVGDPLATAEYTLRVEVATGR